MLQTEPQPNGVLVAPVRRIVPSRAFNLLGIRMAAEAVQALGLAGLMEDIGYACAKSESDFQGYVAKFPPLTEAEVAKVLGMMARTTGTADENPQTSVSGLQNGVQNSEDPTSWNLDVVINVFKTLLPNVSAHAVASGFDHRGFFLPNARAFVFLANAWKKLTPEPYPVTTLSRVMWMNTTGQLSFLTHAVVAPPDIFTFEHAEPKLDPIEGLQSNRLGVGTANGACMSLDLLNLLASLITAGYGSVILQILDHLAKTCPEVLLVGMCAVQRDWGAALPEIFDKIIPNHLLHVNSEMLIQRMWRHNPELVLRGLVVTMERKEGAGTQILRLAKLLDIVLPLLVQVPFSQAFELALIADAQGGAELEPWLIGRLAANPSLPQVLAEMVIARPAVNGAASSHNQQSAQPLPPSVLAKVLRLLFSHQKSLNQDTLNRLKQHQAHALRTIPGMAEILVEDAAFSLVRPDHEQIPKDLETIAEQHFQTLYSGTESPNALLARLKTLKSSSKAQDHLVFKSVVQTLFDEFRFLNKYPEKERNLTAELFSGIIRTDLLDGLLLGEALRLLLEALRLPHTDVYCRFGLKVLQSVTNKFAQLPRVRQHLLQMVDLKDKDPEVAAHLEAGTVPATEDSIAVTNPPPGFANAVVKDPSEPAMGVQVAEQALAEGPSAAPNKSSPEEPKAVGTGATKMQAGEPNGTAQQTPFGTAAIQASKLPGQGRLRGASADGVGTAVSIINDPKHRALHTVNPEILEIASHDDASIVEPPTKVQDKIGFMMNNLTSANVEEKAKELRGLLTEEYWSWFCTYIVIKRAAQEPNFQHLYESLITGLQEKELVRMMITTTYKYVRVLLASPTLAAAYSERMLLKSLGSWLGSLTLAKGQPIRHKDLDLKGIVLDAYETGKMIAILPFINKVLECCKESKVFKASNPYIAAILSVMAEIYATAKLKLNLCFEIEMLFRSFGLTIAETRLSKELSTRKRDTITGMDYTLDKPIGEPSVPSSLPPPSPANSVPGFAEATQSARQSQSANTRPMSATSRISYDGDTAPTVDTAPPSPGLPGIQTQSAPADREIISNLHNLVVINSSLQHYSEKLKRIIPSCVDRAVADIIGPVVERSVQIACISTESLVGRDYACEEDEGKMRKAAHLMSASVAGCMSIVTCKELLRSTLASFLRRDLASELDPSQLEGAVQMITTDNIDLGCSCIEKATVDKVIQQINERFADAFRARQQAAAAGQAFVNLIELNAKLPAMLPDLLRPKTRWVSPQQQRVYEDFARIPKGPSTPPAQGIGADKGGIERAGYDEPAAAGYSHLTEAILHWQHQLEVMCSANPHSIYRPDGGELSMQVQEILNICAEGNDEHAIFAARKIMARLLEVTSSLYVTASIAALSMLKSHANHQAFISDICQTWTNMSDDRKWRKDVVENLVRAGLLPLPDVDAHIFKKLSNKQGFPHAVDCALHLIRSMVLLPEPLATGSDFFSSMDAIQKFVIPQIAPQVAASIQQYIDQARRITSLTSQKISDILEIPAKVTAQVKVVFDEWLQLTEDSSEDSKHDDFVSKLQQLGYLKGDESTDLFFKTLMVLATSHSLSADVQQPSSTPKALNYYALDAVVRLCLLLVNCHSGGTPLLQRILSNMMLCLQREAEFRAEDFNGRPGFRIILGFITEISISEKTNPASFDLLTTIATALLDVHPLLVPGFAFQWLEIISMRCFMPKLVGEQRGWPFFQKLLVSLLRFLEPYLRQAELTDSVRLLYKGTLRVLLVLLHDFPEFLCEFHFEICNAVPASCIQMRNLILSAFPRNMRLPDPFTPNLKVDLLPEIGTPPRYRPPADSLLSPQLRREVDTYLTSRQSSPFLSNMRANFMLSPQEAQTQDTRYNVPLLNAFSFYVGVKEISMAAPGVNAATDSVGMEIFAKMANEMDTEGRYLFLNALANQLRYPNNHTHYFSCILLELFHRAEQEIIQEQITRVLLERLIVNRPHPWGLLITFIELIKNPHYSFWDHQFTHCAGEIERLFDSVARSCMNGPNPLKKEEGLSRAIAS